MLMLTMNAVAGYTIGRLPVECEKTRVKESRRVFASSKVVRNFSTPWSSPYRKAHIE